MYTFWALEGAKEWYQIGTLQQSYKTIAAAYLCLKGGDLILEQHVLAINNDYEDHEWYSELLAVGALLKSDIRYPMLCFFPKLYPSLCRFYVGWIAYSPIQRMSLDI
jgi:hypothetical protein